MQKRHTILATVLLLIIIGCATAAFLVWRQQQRAALLAADIPEIPDLSRWPDALAREVRDATAKARSGSDPVDSLSHLAYLYLGNSYVVQAESPLTALSRLEPSNAQWRYLLGDAHMRRGETNAAEARFEETTRLAPKYTWAWIRLGFLQSQRGAVTEAHQSYTQAAAADPNDLMAAYLLIAFEARNGMGADVRRRMEEFSRAHPGFKEPHEILSELHAASGDEAAATKERRTAATTSRQLPVVDPWIDRLAQFCFDADRLRTLSASAYTQGRFETSVDLLKRAIQISPADALMRDALYSVYERMDRPNEALQTLQQGVIECPDDPNLRVQLSRLFCSLRRPDDAVAAIQPAVQRWPTNAKLRAALGFALSNAGKGEQAVMELREAIRLDSTLVEERFNLGVGLLNLGQRDAARAEVQKALEMRPDYPEAMAVLSVLALEDGDIAAAEPIVNRLYALQPDDPKSKSVFCSLQLLKGAEAERSGNPAEAEKFYRSGLAVVPTYARLLRAQGVLDFRRGRFAEAVESFRAYVQAKPKETEAYFMLGETLRKAGQVDEGRKVLQQGLNLAQQNSNNAPEVEAFKRALEQP